MSMKPTHPMHRVDVFELLINEVICFWRRQKAGEFKRPEQALRIALSKPLVLAGFPALRRVRIETPDDYMTVAIEEGSGAIKFYYDLTSADVGDFLESAATAVFYCAEDTDAILLSVRSVLGSSLRKPTRLQLARIRAEYDAQSFDDLILEFLRRVLACPRRKNFTEADAHRARRVKASRLNSHEVERPLRYLHTIQEWIAHLKGDKSFAWAATILGHLREAFITRCNVEASTCDKILVLDPGARVVALLKLLNAREKELLAKDPVARYNKQLCVAAADNFAIRVLAWAAVGNDTRKRSESTG